MEDNWTADQYRQHLEQKKQAEVMAGKSKYKNKRTIVDGVKFQSTKEGNAYTEYKRQKMAGILKDFKMQVRYVIVVNGIKITSYRADFVLEYPDGSFRIVDVKSDMTRKLNDYVMRKKLMKACFGIEIYER